MARTEAAGKAVPAALTEAIKGAETVLIASHRNPDGDAVGSSLGLAAALRKLGKHVEVFLEDGLPGLYSFLPGSEAVRQQVEGFYDLALVLDSENPKRVSESLRLKNFAGTIANIDHHPTRRRFGDLRYIDVGAAAVGEQIYRLCQALGVGLDRQIAECLYVSILTDTGGFRYSNTRAATHRIAAELIEYGLQPARLASLIYERRTPEQLQLMAAVIAGMHLDGELAWVLIDNALMKQLELTDADLDGTIDLLRSLDGIRVAVMFSQRSDGRVKTSLRSKGDFDVLQVARELGGGGHLAAAGVLSADAIEQVVSRTVGLLLRNLEG